MRTLGGLLPLALALCSLGLSPRPARADPPAFEIREGDRVLLLGDVLLEREDSFGALEARMDAAFATRHFTVRNLSWSGDTPRGLSRASFDPPAQGWERLREQIAAVKPTVAILGYGMAASLQEMTDRSGDILLNPDPARYGSEPMTAKRFRTEMGQLAEAIAAAGEGKVRFVFLGPVAHEDLRAARPGLPDPALHQALLRSYSEELRELATERGAAYVALDQLPGPVTTNGIHLSQEGYERAAEAIAAELHWPAAAAPGEALRAAILLKDKLFFYRWRPENYTYLFGFRKREQGQNAKEIPEFDPLIAEAENRIEACKAAPGAPLPAAPVPATPLPTAPAPLPSFTMQEGYQIELWATNPLLEKPVQMNWDSDGRLWVASSSTYPQVNPEDVATTMALAAAHPGDAPAVANDRILILEDSQHTGHADKSTVFAEGLLIPTAVAPFRNAQGQWSCYVGQSTEILQLTDTHGTGHADRRQVILSGFGTEDTHHIVHTMKWGPDARLNFNQSVYIHSHLETPWGLVRLNSGGVMAWDPRTEKLEVQAKGEWNTWGHVWDAHGNSFLTDGAGSNGVAWAIPGAMFPSYENARRIAPSISAGSYPKFASLERIQSPNFPEDWQGSLITCDFRAHRIVHFGLNDLAPASSGFATQELPDLVRSADASFRPIDVRLGPDGALYVADWSNPIINHGEVDFRDPRRDHHQGRIWRITRQGGPVVPWEKLTEKPKAELAKLGSAQPAWQEQQARLVVAYGPGVAAAPAAGAPVSFEALAESSRDENPRTRLQAMRALAQRQTPEAAAAVLAAALKAPAHDDFYSYAAWLSINDLAAPWAQAVQSGTWKIDSPEREKQLEFALDSIDPLLAAPVLAAVLKAHPLTPEGSGPWIELIGKAGGPAELGQLWAAITGKQLQPAAATRALAALWSAGRLRQVQPAGDLAGAVTLLAAPEPALAEGAARLLGLWQTPGALAALRTTATGTGPAPVRVAAIQALRALATPEARQTLAALVAAPADPALARAATLSLAALDLPQALAPLERIIQAEPTPEARVALWRELLATKGAAAEVARLVKKAGALEGTVAAAGLRAARELGRPGNALAAELQPYAREEAAAADRKNYAALVQAAAQAEPARGEEIFRRPALACLICHAIGGAGGKVGPELTSLGASAPLDYIVESVLDPQAKVKEGYNAVSLTMRDGSVNTGVPARETATEIILRSANGQETPVPKEGVVSRENIGSIMPAGLAQALSPAEQAALFAFLGQLGKPGPYDASKGAVARYWELSAGRATAAAYTLVEGSLTRTMGEAAAAAFPHQDLLATARFQVPAAGEVHLHLTGAPRAELDGHPLEGPAATVKLAPGEHLLTVALPGGHFPEVLRLECPEVRFLGN